MWCSLANALINLPDQVHPLPPEMIFLSTSAEFIFQPHPQQISKMPFKGVQNNNPKDNSFKRFHFKCNLSFMKDQRSIIQKNELKLKISSSCLYVNFYYLFFFLMMGEVQPAFSHNFLCDSTKCSYFLTFQSSLPLFLRWLALKFHEGDY